MWLLHQGNQISYMQLKAPKMQRRSHYTWARYWHNLIHILLTKVSHQPSPDSREGSMHNHEHWQVSSLKATNATNYQQARASLCAGAGTPKVTP